MERKVRKTGIRSILFKVVYQIGILYFIKKLFNILQSKEKKIITKEENLKTFEKWMNKIQDGKSINTYFIENNYSKIAIYGMGHIGKTLYRNIQTAGMQVAYGIDCSVRKYDSIQCYTFDAELPEVDLIIVTVSAEVDYIIDELTKKVDCPIETMNNILFML